MDNRKLFDFASGFPALQAENHIAGAFKKSGVLFPAHAAFAVLQADKLLFHFPATAGAGFVAGSHKFIPTILLLVRIIAFLLPVFQLFQRHFYKKINFFKIYQYFAPSNLRLVKGFFSYIQIRIFPFFLLRTLPEKTLRNWNAGAGTGPGEKTGKTLKCIQILNSSRCRAGKPSKVSPY